MYKEKLYTLIQSPIITEQTAQLGEKINQVVFKVDLDANKREIKKAVEKLFVISSNFICCRASFVILSSVLLRSVLKNSIVLAIERTTF